MQLQDYIERQWEALTERYEEEREEREREQEHAASEINWDLDIEEEA